MKITFQNQTVTDTENRTESIQMEKNTWGRDKIQRNKKSVNANTFGAVYESGQIPMPVGNEENNKGIRTTVAGQNFCQRYICMRKQSISGIC